MLVVHPSVSDDLAQLALLYNMSGEFEKALPLLHKRLVIHEKFGPGAFVSASSYYVVCYHTHSHIRTSTHHPDELTGETLQDLGTVYRLHGVLEVAQQHLERALTIRKRCHGAESLKVAETLNSLALVHLVRSDVAQAEACQLQSLQVLFESAEPEDIESEDVPWEVYKRLKQQRGPSTASNSVTLLKGNMRKRVMAVAFASAPPQAQAPLVQQTGDARQGQNSGPSSPVGRSDASHRRAVRSHSDTGAMKQYVDSAAEQATERRPPVSAPRDDASAGVPDSLRILIQSTDARNNNAVATPAPRSQQLRPQPLSPFSAPPHRRLEPPPAPIPDLQTLQHRVEVLKRRISSGFGETDDELARLGADVDATEAPALREVGFTMLSLVREMHRLRVTSMDAARRLPVLEGPLEKKSASIFRGWEKRWFKVDPKTFVLSYHFSKDDYARGFAPRGGFPLSRVANILVHRHARGHYFHFDVVVDLSTRLNPLAARTYELRCEDEDTLRYWVETLHYYKATAQATPARPATS